MKTGKRTAQSRDIVTIQLIGNTDTTFEHE